MSVFIFLKPHFGGVRIRMQYKRGLLLFLEGMPNSPQPWHTGQAKPILVDKDEVS